MQQGWRCERCTASGTTVIPEGTDVLTAVRLLAAAHAEVQPACAEDFGTESLRVDT